jgi:hypothetical protein
MHNVMLWNFSSEPAQVEINLKALPRELRMRHIVLDAAGAGADENLRLRPDPLQTLKAGDHKFSLKLEPWAIHYWSLEYSAATAGVATADKVTGPYKFVKFIHVNSDNWAQSAREGITGHLDEWHPTFPGPEIKSTSRRRSAPSAGWTRTTCFRMGWPRARNLRRVWAPFEKRKRAT